MLKKNRKSKEQTNQETNINITNQKNLNLEALRGILALMVVIGHISLIRLYFGRSDDYMNPIIFHLGRVGVTGFFVLSGYLISYSILKRMANNEWSIGRFYAARIFRIWPLYFFVIIMAIYVLPNINQLQFIVPGFVIDARIETFNYWYYLFLMPQVPLINNYILPFAEPTWSIGVEEIFYLIIPIVIMFSKKRINQILIAFISIFLIAKYIVIYYYQLPFSDYVAKLFNYYRYDCVAFGCLIAVMHFNSNKVFMAINKLHALAAIVLIYIMFKNLTINSYDYFPFAICFGVIISYFVKEETTFKSPKWLIYIGTISYSLYLTHEIVVVYFVNLDFDKKSMPLTYIICLIFAIILASIIYYIIEKPFMDLYKSKILKNKIETKTEIIQKH